MSITKRIRRIRLVRALKPWRLPDEEIPQTYRRIAKAGRAVRRAVNAAAISTRDMALAFHAAARAMAGAAHVFIDTAVAHSRRDED